MGRTLLSAAVDFGWLVDGLFGCKGEFKSNCKGKNNINTNITATDKSVRRTHPC